MNEQTTESMQSIVMDGNLERAEALGALSAAALAATAALPDALIKCETQAQMQKVIADRDTCQLAYTNSLVKSLTHTGPMFEKVAKDLEDEAKNIKRQSQSLKDAIEAINLMSEAVRLASSLALAFG